MVSVTYLPEGSLQYDLLLFVGLVAVVSAVMFVVCCAGGGDDKPRDSQASSNPRSTKGPARPQKTAPSAPSRAAESSASPEARDSGYLNVPIPINSSQNSASLTINAYMNASAAGTRFEPVQFDINKVVKSLKKILDPHRLDDNRLQLLEVIGKGAFGLVYKGTLRKPPSKELQQVAVKTVHGDDCSPADMKSFLEEVVRMCGFKHSNVQSTLGICFRSSQPYAVMPFMDYGDLRGYVISPENELTLRRLVEFALQIAKGMEYLAKQKFVHRDLATRNCMINKDLVVKVADFGLSRDMYTSDYYRMKADNHTPLPVRWMAPESMRSLVFTSKTDVWSFGIVMWELMTRGQTPYYNLPSLAVIKHVKGGGQPEKLDGWPSSLYSIMESCWCADPQNRPGFSTLVRKIHALLGSRRC